MTAVWGALWAESVKARRSRVLPFTIAASLLLPLADGFFMFILKDPGRARAMGLIGVKAQLAAGVADWPTFLQVLTQGTAIGGGMLFAFVAAWVFGREFSDRTAKELLALPTARTHIVGAKLVVAAAWMLGLVGLIFGAGLLVGNAVNIPGWSRELAWKALGSIGTIGVLLVLLMPFVALFASLGRGYLSALGWALLTVVFGQILIVLGWGDWFPWSVPAIASGMTGPTTGPLEMHSYIVVALTFMVGVAATLLWWQRADQPR